MKTYNFIVTGKVQGVYYRKTINENVATLNINGYVKNLKNGNVEVEATCDDENYQRLIKILKNGSTNSRVDDIKITIIDKVYTNGFRIEY